MEIWAKAMRGGGMFWSVVLVERGGGWEMVIG